VPPRVYGRPLLRKKKGPEHLLPPWDFHRRSYRPRNLGGETRPPKGGENQVAQQRKRGLGKEKKWGPRTKKKVCPPKRNGVPKKVAETKESQSKRNRFFYREKSFRPN